MSSIFRGRFRSPPTIQDALDIIGLARPLVTGPDLSLGLMDGTSQGAQAYERRLKIGKGRFGPNSRIVLFKALNTLGPVAWYYRQSIHLAENRALQLDLGVLKALLLHQTTEVRLAQARRKALQSLK